MSHFKTSLLLVCIVAAKYTSAQSNLIVNTTSGIFEGNTAESGLERWLGIPYAQPPVGGLRFKAPVPVTDPAPDVKQALEFGDACPQPGANLGAPISEDCLYLNIYRPEGTNSSANLPILVFIHVSTASQEIRTVSNCLFREGNGQTGQLVTNIKKRLLV